MLILRQALAIAKRRDDFRDIFESTAAIFFLACVHDERPPDFESRFLRIAMVELGLSGLRRHAVSDALRLAEDWQTVKEVLGNFRTLSIPCGIRTFCESKATVYRSKTIGRDKSDIVSQRPDG